MKKLEKVPFIRMLDTLLNRRLSDAECTAFHASYEEFIDLLHSLTAQSCRSPLDLLHELARLQSSLMRLQERIIEKESPQASSVDEFRDPFDFHPASLSFHRRSGVGRNP